MSGVDNSTKKETRRHRRRLSNLIDRLPRRLRDAVQWLLKPESRWARIPAGVLLILGGFLSILPVFGLWMLPLGLLLLAEDIPAVRRILARLLDWFERRWPHWFSKPDSN
jgi:hypothetical protein